MKVACRTVCKCIMSSTHQRRAMRIGVVRQDVNRSAGSSGFCGNSSLLPQAASKIVFLALEAWSVPDIPLLVLF